MQIQEFTLQSKALLCEMRILILLPTQRKEGDGNYRVLWLLHGSGQDAWSWIREAKLDEMMDSKGNLMAVLPTRGTGDYTNHFEIPGGNFPAFFFEELLPFVYETFPASRNPEDNILSGFSMGGSGTLLLGFKKPSLFCALYPLGSSLRDTRFLLPFMGMTGEEFRSYACTHKKSLPTEYGDPGEGITDREIEAIAKYRSVRDYLTSEECVLERFQDVRERGEVPKIHFICGSRDPSCEKLLKFMAEVRAGGLGEEQITLTLLEGLTHEESMKEAARILLQDLKDQS